MRGTSADKLRKGPKTVFNTAQLAVYLCVINSSMRRTILLFTLISTLFVIVQACKHDPIDLVLDEDTPLTPIDTTGGPDTTLVVSDCDEDTVYFVNDIYPIFISNCAISGCHDVESHEEGIVLSTYEDIMDADIIDIFDPTDCDLYEVITDNDSDDRMPPAPMAKLTAAEIAMLVTWMDQGALNNSCTDCDTAAVTYSGTISAIMDAYCTGCHDHSTPAGSIDLTVYVGTGSISGVSDVAADGSLLGSLNFEAAYTSMPQGAAQLPQCLIDQISAWVDAGYPDN